MAVFRKYQKICSHGRLSICVTKVMLTLDECQRLLFVDMGAASIEVGKLHQVSLCSFLNYL